MHSSTKTKKQRVIQSHWNINEWLPQAAAPDFKMISQPHKVIFEEEVEGGLAYLQTILERFAVPHTQVEGEKKALSLERKIPIPPIDFNRFIDILIDWHLVHAYLTGSASPYPSLTYLLLQGYISQIRLISEDASPLKFLFRRILDDAPYDGLKTLIKEALNYCGLEDPLFSRGEGEEQEDDEEDEEDYKHPHSLFAGHQITTHLTVRPFRLNNILHILRHPTNARQNLVTALTSFQDVEQEPIFLSSLLSLVEPQGVQLHLVTVLPNLSYRDPGQEKAEEVALPTPVLHYWLVLGSILLRNIAYAMLKFPNLRNIQQKEAEFFFTSVKSKLQKFVDSCVNPDLVDAYVIFDRSFDEGGLGYLHTPELLSFNRGRVLEKRLKIAEAEYNKNPRNKLFRKRVNRRKNRLHDFLGALLSEFFPFVTETMEVAKVSGKYSQQTLRSFLSQS